MDLIITIGFGLVALSSLFLVVIFYRAWLDKGLRHDRRYRTASGALSIGKMGIAIWALNPLMQAFDGPPLPLWLMAMASAMILGSAMTLIGSTALGNGNKRTLCIFLCLGALWTIFCLSIEAAPL